MELQLNRLYNMDCMEGMAAIPDGYFELAIVDPPYGINVTKMNMGRGKSRKSKKTWDKQIPDDAYFKELFRVSKNQVIWGGNYFPLPPTRGFLVWDKGESMYGRSFSECEFAWTSFDRPARIRKIYPKIQNRIHPTQKPVELYRWVLEQCATPGDKILDTHAGSASCLIACVELGYDFMGYEIDGDYYTDGNDRLEAAKTIRRQK